MQIDTTSSIPIFQQLAEGLENAILSGTFAEEDQVPSTTEISVRFKINPATALKGLNLLVQAGVIYKKRGLGMFVASGAVKMIQMKRKTAFHSEFVRPLFAEARRIGLTQHELSELLRDDLTSFETTPQAQAFGRSPQKNQEENEQ